MRRFCAANHIVSIPIAYSASIVPIKFMESAIAIRHCCHQIGYINAAHSSAVRKGSMGPPVIFRALYHVTRHLSTNWTMVSSRLGSDVALRQPRNNFRISLFLPRKPLNHRNSSRPYSASVGIWRNLNCDGAIPRCARATPLAAIQDI